jgi:hypothetical protein
MATPTELGFSSPGGGGDDSDDNPPQKRTSKRTASETATEEETKKKKKKKTKHNTKMASPPSNRIWNEEDELSILKGLVDFRAKTGLESKIDWDAFYCYVKGSIHVKVSKCQLMSKTRKLKKKFLDQMEKIDQGNDPHFTRSSETEAFGYSMMIWRKIDAEYTNGVMDKAHQSESGEEVFEEDEEVALIDKGAAKSGKSPHEAVVVVDKITTKKNGTAGKESDDDDDDGLCAVRAAFETTMMSQGLSDYQKKLQLEKLMNLGTGKRRELSNEWKALCVEELKLNINKLRFSAKLAEAANDGK